MRDRSRPLAFVTASSSGIGHAYALGLARKGYDLIVVARRTERLSSLQKMVSAFHADAEILALDLTTDEGRYRAVARIASGDVSFVANIAGFGHYGAFDRVSPSQIAELLAIHVRAVTEITHAAILHGPRPTTIVNVASLLALSGGLPPEGLPGRAVYAGAKSFMLTFTETLAAETLEGVNVQVVLPGLVATEYGGGYDAAYSMSPEDVVRASMSALERAEVVCVPGLDDPQLLVTLQAARLAVLRAGNRRELAARYQ